MTATLTTATSEFLLAPSNATEQVNSVVIPEAYLEAAFEKSTAKQIDDGWIAEIPGFDGVWSQGETREVAVAELRNVLAGWLCLKIEDRDDDIPLLDEINLNP